MKIEKRHEKQETRKLSRRKSRSAEAARPDKDREPLQDRIAKRAYEIYLNRGATDHHDIDDWLQAERQILEKEQ